MGSESLKNTEENTSPYRRATRIETGYRLKTRGDKIASIIFPMALLWVAATGMTAAIDY